MGFFSKKKPEYEALKKVEEEEIESKELTALKKQKEKCMASIKGLEEEQSQYKAELNTLRNERETLRKGKMGVESQVAAQVMKGIHGQFKASEEQGLTSPVPDLQDQLIRYEKLLKNQQGKINDCDTHYQALSELIKAKKQELKEIDQKMNLQSEKTITPPRHQRP